MHPPTPPTPYNVIDGSYTGDPIKTLEPGENVYAYIAGLTGNLLDVSGLGPNVRLLDPAIAPQDKP